MVLPPANALLSNDLIEVPGGEILSLCGTTRLGPVRARLAYYPDRSGGRQINGRPYRKVTYETGRRDIPGCRQVMFRTGEQQYLVPRQRIVRHYSGRAGFTHVLPEFREDCGKLIDLLEAECGIPPQHHGLTGSGATGGMTPESDFDWLLYWPDPEPVRQLVIGRPDLFVPALTFNLAHVERKYAAITGLTGPALHRLFTRRWKYFRFGRLHVSLTFIDVNHQCDQLQDPPLDTRVIELAGEITSATAGSFSPYVLPVVTPAGQQYSVLSWMFLYNGAFKAGDRIEVTGQSVQLAGRPYIHVAHDEHFIRHAKDGSHV